MLVVSAVAALVMFAGEGQDGAQAAASNVCQGRPRGRFGDVNEDAQQPGHDRWSRKRREDRAQIGDGLVVRGKSVAGRALWTGYAGCVACLGATIAESEGAGGYSSTTRSARLRIVRM